MKLFFFSLDPGYRDERSGGALTCQAGPACVYARYQAAEGGATALIEEGITDLASFTDWYWAGQIGSAQLLVGSTLGAALLGGLLYLPGAPRAVRKESDSSTL